jgi:hypothetical protein
MNTIFVAIILALSATAVLAEPLPVEKPRGPGGSCPNGFISSGFTGSAMQLPQAQRARQNNASPSSPFF